MFKFLKSMYNSEITFCDIHLSIRQNDVMRAISIIFKDLTIAK